MTRQEADCIIAVIKGVRKETGNQRDSSFIIDEKGIETILNMVDALGNNSFPKYRETHRDSYGDFYDSNGSADYVDNGFWESRK